MGGASRHLQSAGSGYLISIIFLFLITCENQLQDGWLVVCMQVQSCHPVPEKVQCHCPVWVVCLNELRYR